MDEENSAICYQVLESLSKLCPLFVELLTALRCLKDRSS
jgi:hypothetical protein